MASERQSPSEDVLIAEEEGCYRKRILPRLKRPTFPSEQQQPFFCRRCELLGAEPIPSFHTREQYHDHLLDHRIADVLDVDDPLTFMGMR